MAHTRIYTRPNARPRAPKLSLRRSLRPLALLLVLAVPAACRKAAPSLGTTPAEAYANANDLLGSLAARFGPALHDPAYAASRPKFAKSSLAPSRIFDDRSVWTGMERDTRTLELTGTRTPRGYWIGVRAGAAPPRRPADYRGILHLTRLGDSEYEWRARDELALGTVRTDDLARALGTIFTAAESRNDEALRDAYRDAFPRATAALGRLFSLDSLRTEPAADGATLVTLGISVHPDRLKDGFPHLAKYLDKYLSPASYRIIVEDATKARWWDVRGDDNRLTVRFSVRDGSLVPLNTSPRRIPDRLRVHVDARVKISIFTVGVRDLVGDVTLTRIADEKGFTARFRREPDWILPPLVKTLIRSPLRRPFEGEGALLHVSVEDGSGAPTLLARDYAVLVKESAIIRWFNGLGSTAVGDFRKGAEVEYDRFNGEALSALHADALALTALAAAAK